MGCCQNSSKPDSKEINIQCLKNDSKSQNLEILQDLTDQFFYKEKCVAMTIDKLEMEINFLLSKYKIMEASLFFHRKILFQEFLNEIENDLEILNKSVAKPQDFPNIDLEKLKKILNDIQNSSDINFSFNEWQNLSQEQKNLVQKQFEIWINQYLKKTSGDIDDLFKNYENEYNKYKSNA